MDHNEPILQIADVSKSFPGVQALDRINLRIGKGEVHALLGENGAGKSTLVKILVGAYKKDAGSIMFDGRKREFTSPAEAYKSGISVIYQETSLIPQLTVLQNIFLGMEYVRTFLGILDQQRLLRAYDDVCEKLGFRFQPNELVRNLSVAEQKMVEILKAMAHQASFIIMDEPTDSLSDNEIQHLFTIIRDLKNHQITVLYITHYLEEVFQITDRITVLRDGKKVDTVETQAVNTQDIVRMMVGQEISNSAYQTTKRTGRREALRVDHLTRKLMLADVSLTAYEGEILGIAGVIGSGKTELARAIFGADPIDSGQVFISGEPCDVHSPVAAVQYGVGMLPEDRKTLGLLLNHEVYKNITLPALDRFISSMILNKTAELSVTDQIVKRLDVKIASPYQAVKYLSGGNQQKIVVGKWLTVNPRILIMDEPTRGIDVGSKSEIHRIMRQLAAEGTCIIFISAEVPEIVEVSDRILVMKKGRIYAEYSRGVTQEQLMQAMLEGDNK
jgi:ribose transport system ATP-binding protein